MKLFDSEYWKRQPRALFQGVQGGDEWKKNRGTQPDSPQVSETSPQYSAYRRITSGRPGERVVTSSTMVEPFFQGLTLNWAPTSAPVAGVELIASSSSISIEKHFRNWKATGAASCVFVGRIPSSSLGIPSGMGTLQVCFLLLPKVHNRVLFPGAQVVAAMSSNSSITTTLVSQPRLDYKYLYKPR